MLAGALNPRTGQSTETKDRIREADTATSGRHYGDLPLWDMLFGTYENPPTWDATCGFETERELRLGEMLAFRDVHRE